MTKEQKYTLEYLSLANNGYTIVSFCKDKIVKEQLPYLIECGEVVEVKNGYVCLKKDEEIVSNMLIRGVY